MFSQFYYHIIDGITNETSNMVYFFDAAGPLSSNLHGCLQVSHLRKVSQDWSGMPRTFKHFPAHGLFPLSNESVSVWTKRILSVSSSYGPQATISWNTRMSVELGTSTGA